MSLIIKAEELAGSDIKDTAKEMIVLAKNIGATIEVNFNGVKLFAKPNGSHDRIVENYHRVLNGTDKSKMAWSH